MRGKRTIRQLVVACGVGLGALLAGSAQAAVLLQFDLNSVNLQARDAAGANSSFSATHTGSLVLSKGLTGVIVDPRIDGVPQNGSLGSDDFVGTLDSVSGVISLVNGTVQGGTLTFTVTSVEGADSYSLDIADTDAPVVPIAGGFFSLGALAVNGDLTDGSFAGVNVQAFSAAEPLNGGVIMNLFQPNANGAATVNVEISAVVPEPASLAAATLLVGGLLLRRRRGV